MYPEIAQFLAGLLIGYVAISICESFFHSYIGHAPAGLRDAWRRLGAFGKPFLRAWRSHHTIHHHLTFRSSHTVQFANAGDAERIRRLARRRTWHDPVLNDFGLIVGRSFIQHFLFLVPSLPAIMALCALGEISFSIGVLIAALLMPAASQFVHPWLHQPHADVLTKAPTAIRWLARTGYFQKIARRHWLHHRYGDCNYNLLPGGDWIFGVHRRETEADLMEMRRCGLWTPAVKRQAPIIRKRGKTQ